jgi:hypothetical protein
LDFGVQVIRKKFKKAIHREQAFSITAEMMTFGLEKLAIAYRS